MKIERQLDELETFLNSVEDYLDKRADETQSEDERQKFEEYFPNHLRSALFVTLYSAVENELNRLCSELKKDDGLCVDDLKGSGIQRACHFLVKVCRVNFPEGSKEWKLLRNFNLLRNVIVHNLGREEAGNSHLKTLIENREDLRVGEDGVIYLDQGFCPSVLETIRDFFKLLDDAINEKQK